MSMPEPPQTWTELAAHVLAFYTLAFERLLQAAAQDDPAKLADVKRAAGRVCADVAYWHLSAPPQDDTELNLSAAVIRPACDTLLMVLLVSDPSRMQNMPCADPNELAQAFEQIVGQPLARS